MWVGFWGHFLKNALFFRCSESRFAAAGNNLGGRRGGGRSWTYVGWDNLFSSSHERERGGRKKGRQTLLYPFSSTRFLDQQMHHRFGHFFFFREKEIWVSEIPAFLRGKR